jgi:CHAT domain-containing protein
MGDIKIGEGVFGLRRAFAVAGAKTLVMSLWSVPDRATALLMERFFTNLRQGLGRADALQDAQNYIRTITVKELQQSSLGLAVQSAQKAIAT